MRMNGRGFIVSTLTMPAIVLVLAVSVAKGAIGQTTDGPVFKDYRGISIGMSAEEVRAKLDGIKKGKAQDFVTFSDRESAQIYYDDNNKVTAISIDYFGADSNAPPPDAVLGAAPQAKPDGSLYQLNRYPQAGFWVSYNRTAGDKPIVTITMQKM